MGDIFWIMFTELRKLQQRIQHEIYSHQQCINKLHEYRLAIDQEMKRTIKSHVKRTHNFDELECMVKAPLDYFVQKMVGWDRYIPARKRPGYEYYFKTYSEEVFLASWQVPLEYNFVGFEGLVFTMRITISPHSPVRIIYNQTKKQLILTYWYQLHPCPQDYHPARRIHNGYLPKKIWQIDWDRHQQYWEDKQ